MPKDAARRVQAVLATLPAPCRQLARYRPVKVVYGPGTFANTAANEIYNGVQATRTQYTIQADRAARAAVTIAKQKGYPPSTQKRFANDARQLAYSQSIRQTFALALRYGPTQVPSVDAPD